MHEFVGIDIKDLKTKLQNIITPLLDEVKFTTVFPSISFQKIKYAKYNMNWITIYITGQSDFREEVKKKLEHANLNFMPGYVENFSPVNTHDLYWIDDQTDLRSLKEAIGSKLIWKYRLRFFDTLESFIESQSTKKNDSSFTPEELHLIAEMEEALKHPSPLAKSA